MLVLWFYGKWVSYLESTQYNNVGIWLKQIGNRIGALEFDPCYQPPIAAALYPSHIVFISYLTRIIVVVCLPRVIYSV